DEAKRYSSGPGLELRMESRNTDRYIEYRELDDVILTALLTSDVDPQRGTRMKPTEAMIKKLHDSLHHQGRFVVAHTDIKPEGTIPKAEMVEVSQYTNPYFDRW